MTLNEWLTVMTALARGLDVRVVSGDPAAVSAYMARSIPTGSWPLDLADGWGRLHVTGSIPATPVSADVVVYVD